MSSRALVHDMGWSGHLPSDAGLLPFSTPEDALDELERMAGDWETHSRRASDIAEEHFAASRVLQGLIEVALG